MSVGADDLILHHHDAGYYSQKARVLLGVLGLSWHSVIEPLMSPKPEFVKLTGGYQRVPALQIGSDVFCDSKLVMAELERRAPQGHPFGGIDMIVNAWADKLMTPATFAVALPDMSGQMPEVFIQDRREIYGPSFDLDAIAGAQGLMSQQWRAQVAWLEDALAASDGEFLTGAQATVADVAAFMSLWLVDQREALAANLATPTKPIDTPPPPRENRPSDHAERLLDGFDRVRAWRERMTAIGHGDRSEATHEEAFAVVRSTEPAAPPEHDASDPSGLQPGTTVTVMADDSTRDPVTGTLVAATARELVLARADDDLGTVHVHFPRWSYYVSAA
jgi:glutathione S-transferase